MRIALDTTGVQVTQAGTTTYTKALLRALRAMPDGPDVVELACRQRFSRKNRILRTLDTLNREALWLKTQLPRRLANDSVDVLHCPTPHVPTRSQTPVVATIHDLYVLHDPQAFPAWHRHSSIHFLRETIRRADQIVTISDATKNDILSRFGNHLEPRIHRIHEAADERFAPPTPDENAAIRARYDLPEKYILSVATVEPRKNLDRLLDAFFQIANQVPHDLVLTGATGWKMGSLPKKVEQSGFGDRVQFLGYVDFLDLPSLYATADTFCFPSLFEGFGLPILEAMACGCPVLTSTTSCMPEVAGDAAALVDPLDTEAISATLASLLEDEPRRADLRSRGLDRATSFSWERCARETVQVYEQAMG